MKRFFLISACFAAAATLSFASRRAVAQEFSVGAYGSVDYEATRTVLKADNSAINENGFSIPTLDLFLRGCREGRGRVSGSKSRSR